MMPDNTNNDLGHADNQFIRAIKWIADWFHRDALYIWTTTWILFGLALGLFTIFIATNNSLTNFGIIAIWAFAYFLLGALIGCIFGVPKVISKPHSNGTDPAKQSTDANGKSASTNLTDVSEWLTKIVIGAGLVQLNKIPGYVLRIGDRMALGINLASNIPSKILCTGVIIYYVCFGLIAGYFVMRSIFLNLMHEQ